MTVIAAVVDKGRVLMGADSFCSAGERIEPIAQVKLWAAGDMVIGAAGNLRTCNLFRYGFKFPERAGETDEIYMHITVPHALRQYLQEHQPIESNGASEDCGLEALIGWKGKIWQLASDFCVTSSRHGYDAVGRGSAVCRAALDATARHSDLTGSAILLEAMRLTARHVVSVQAPFYMQAEGELMAGEVA